MLYRDFLETISVCPFCNGANRIIIQSGKSFLTYALAPYHKHHLLIVPNRHIETLEDILTEEKDDVDLLQDKALKILKKLGYETVSFLVREGNEHNKSVRHVHFHVIPDIAIGDLDHYGNERRIMSQEEISRTIEEIKNVANDALIV